MVQGIRDRAMSKMMVPDSVHLQTSIVLCHILPVSESVFFFFNLLKKFRYFHSIDLVSFFDTVE